MGLVTVIATLTRDDTGAALPNEPYTFNYRVSVDMGQPENPWTVAITGITTNPIGMAVYKYSLPVETYDLEAVWTGDTIGGVIITGSSGIVSSYPVKAMSVGSKTRVVALTP